MVHGQMRLVLRHLRRLVRRPEEGESSDAALLERFANNNDEAAFEELLRRHAALVHGVCRRVLGNAPDVEDAFQATFLVLVRKAGSLKREGPLAPWLYTVAVRLAKKARSRRSQQAFLRELPEPLSPADPLAEISGRELAQAFDAIHPGQTDIDQHHVRHVVTDS